MTQQDTHGAVRERCAAAARSPLGSGGGLDVLMSARRVGPTGTAYRLDMTGEMLDLARRNQDYPRDGAFASALVRGTKES